MCTNLNCRVLDEQMTVALLSGGNLSKERWTTFAVTKVFAVRTGWSIGCVLYRCPCWRLWLSLWRANIPLYPLLLRLWIVSSTKGQDMITDTLCSASQGRDLEKHHGFIVALVITFELLISSQTRGIQRVFVLIGTRIRSWIFFSPFILVHLYLRLWMSDQKYLSLSTFHKSKQPLSLRLWINELLSNMSCEAANPFLWYLSEVELSAFLINFPLILRVGCDISEIWACGAQVRCSYADGGAFIAILTEMWSVGLYM